MINFYIESYPEAPTVANATTFYQTGFKNQSASLPRRKSPHKRDFIFQPSIFRGHVTRSFQEANPSNQLMFLNNLCLESHKIIPLSSTRMSQEFRKRLGSTGYFTYEKNMGHIREL